MCDAISARRVPRSITLASHHPNHGNQHSAREIHRIGEKQISEMIKIQRHGFGIA
jgi:hypothetical protein